MKQHYKCSSCNEQFDDPKENKHNELHTEVDDRKSETITTWLCPWCDSEEIEEMSECACGHGYYLPPDNLCEDCKEAMSWVIERMGELRNVGYNTAKQILYYGTEES